MTTPPAAGAFQLTRTVPGAVTDTDGVLGAPGAAGMIDADLATDGVLPATLFAVTRNVYDVAASTPVKSQSSALVLRQPAGTETDGSAVTVYPLGTGTPDDAVQLTRTVFAAVTCTVGVPGAPGTAGPTGAALGADPALPPGPTAVTTNVYDDTALKPVKSHITALVPTQAGGGVTPGLELTE